ncbi:MAG TPA: TRAP transporter small permease [Desulfofustis sp.]|jgi:TRAP-type C4-dicarboxylate transport system permease small subunit|nr:TRAP transporter small permease [Desulfofustis sp. PB-SRB1]HBH28128.1 TRAP transporter small permease [Desulfofustis sp.]HBH30744.1 TRAP transporter small permease [Desulfofustis sp.]
MSFSSKTLISNLDLILAGFFLCITVLVVIVNVALRYLFHGGIYWAEEVATTAFIWSVFVGAAAAYRYKMHIGIDFITKIGPHPWRALIAVIIDALMLAINGYIVYLSIFFIQSNKLKRTPVLDIPAFYVNLALTVGFTLMTLYALMFLYRDIRKLFSGQHG